MRIEVRALDMLGKHSATKLSLSLALFCFVLFCFLFLFFLETGFLCIALAVLELTL
jgi:hypothetical protein